LFVPGEECYFFFFFLAAFFFAAIVSILPFHCSWIRDLKKIATYDCIEILKIEVKKKIDVIFDGSYSLRVLMSIIEALRIFPADS